MVGSFVLSILPYGIPYWVEH